jgi:hypothetical protein
MPLEPPDELRSARRELLMLAGVELLEDFRWRESVQRWALKLALTIRSSSALVPATTHWYVLVPPEYARGEINFFPCKERGLKHTFQHQLYNGVIVEDWRSGNLCLSTDVHALEKRHLLPEQYGARNSLRWHCARALQWLELAATGQLAVPGDPFELPALPGILTGLSVAFNESGRTLDAWLKGPRSGLFEYSRVGGLTEVVRKFLTLGSEELRVVAWGTDIANDSHVRYGAWLLVDQIPVLEPWQAPATWKDLATALATQEKDLYALLEPIANRLRDGNTHPLLIGFPIPSVIGGLNHHVHWFALRLPVFSTYERPPKGFRPTSKSLWVRDRHLVLSSGKALNWLSSENWHQDELAARGRVAPSLRDQKVGVIGAGALGSNFTEQLVRAGVHNLTVVDPDIVRVGNLVRHTLTVADVSENKAVALGKRLNALSPHAKVAGLKTEFSGSNQSVLEALEDCDLIIETTGEDDVIDELGGVTWQRPKRFICVSVGTEARRLYFYCSEGVSFPTADFRNQVDPFLAEEGMWDIVFPREGTGCWHPIFPARSDDFALWGGVAVKRLNQHASEGAWVPQLEVYEQHEDGQGFGIRRIERAAE